VVEPIWSIERLIWILLLFVMVATAWPFQLPVCSCCSGRSA